MPLSPIASINMVLKFRKVNKDVFTSIRDGVKKVETRAATEKYRDIKAGDIITLSCGKEKFEKTVVKVTIFPSIKSMLRVYEVQDINPFISAEKDLEEMYFSFPGYKSKIKEFGLIALELE